jgi:MOSC domain-containing protein YiiM
MKNGHVVSIHIGTAAKAPMQAVDSVRAIPGRGLEGDRYCNLAGTFSKKLNPAYEVTLIESEALEALARDCGIELAPGASRRNLTTRGVALNHLVGREFTVGGARLRGIKLCEPCGHLESLTQAGVREGLLHRGGLRAQVLEGGDIRVGDPVMASPEPAP